MLLFWLLPASATTVLSLCSLSENVREGRLCVACSIFSGDSVHGCQPVNSLQAPTSHQEDSLRWKGRGALRHMGKKLIPRLPLQQGLGVRLSPFEGASMTRSHVTHFPHNLTHSRPKMGPG